jgi:hypothetical protein
MSDSASGQACKGMSWTVDAWGNMTNQTGTAGNMISDGSHTYSYDAENRIIQVDNGSTAK